MTDLNSGAQDATIGERSEGNCYVALTHTSLDILVIMNRVRSPKAGAIVLFAGNFPYSPASILQRSTLYPSYFCLLKTAPNNHPGTTRDNFASKPVKELEYTAYKPKALRTMLEICKAIAAKHSLTSIAMIHRLGIVPIGEESILIAVSSPHRQAAWRAGEEALEQCKEKVEVWKKEEFGGEEGGVWRANRDGKEGWRVDARNDALSDGEGVVRPGPMVEKGHGAVVHPGK
jgi:molybdopterin synthase catalytic subunit